MQIRSTLADGIRAVVAQVLFKRIDKKGRCAALEILIANSAVRNLIRESKTFQIRLDATNILNHPGVGNPSLDINSANAFGLINVKDDSKREFKGSLRLTF